VVEYSFLSGGDAGRSQSPASKSLAQIYTD